MMCYVSFRRDKDETSIKRAKSIVHDLQMKDLSNCYVCPLLAFSHFRQGEIGFDDETELCLDLLTCADKLIVCDEISESVRLEIDFAKLVKTEVVILDKNGELRPLAE